MKILLVGADSNYAIERPYLRYMATHPDVEYIELFAAQNKFLEYYNKSILHKILYRTGFSSILKTINYELLREIDLKKPDVVFIFKGMEILPKSVQMIKESGIKTPNYNPDNPFIFSGRGSGNKNVTDSIGLYDMHFSYDTTVAQRIKTEFGIPCLLLPFAFDVSEELYNKCASENEIVKPCFVGAPDTMRAEFINSLINKGIEIDLYGPNWSNYISHTNANILPAVYNEELWKTLRKYRVQLNIMRIHNLSSHNMRSFEVPGIGGIMLAPDTPDHRAFFKENEEVFLYQSADDCAIKISKILQQDSNEIELMRKRIRDKCLNSAYTYKDRANFVVDTFKKLV